MPYSLDMCKLGEKYLYRVILLCWNSDLGLWKSNCLHLFAKCSIMLVAILSSRGKRIAVVHQLNTSDLLFRWLIPSFLPVLHLTNTPLFFSFYTVWKLVCNFLPYCGFVCIIIRIQKDLLKHAKLLPVSTRPGLIGDSSDSIWSICGGTRARCT